MDAWPAVQVRRTSKLTAFRYRATKTTSIREPACQDLVKKRFCLDRPGGPVFGHTAKTKRGFQQPHQTESKVADLWPLTRQQTP